MPRTAHIHRQTAETDIELELILDGSGQADVQTGVGFLDHMLDAVGQARGVRPDACAAKGDLHVDQHHTVEDVGICLGQALKQALGDKAGIRRYGHFTLPMEETLVTAAIDLSGRYALVVPGAAARAEDRRLRQRAGRRLLATPSPATALCNLHVLLHYGRNSHHISEAIFKATARALRMAVELDPRMTGVPSTKGTLGN